MSRQRERFPRGGSTLSRLLLLCALAGLISPGCAQESGEADSGKVTPAAGHGDTYFAVSGDVTAEVDAADATLVKIRGTIPAMTIVSAPASVRKLGTSYSVNLFFPEGFEPKPGVYPIRFSYRKHPDTLGGSFLQRGARFSHDTEGTAEFTEFGDKVRVRFEFEVFDRSEGKDGRKRVLVKGEAVSAPADIF